LSSIDHPALIAARRAIAASDDKLTEMRSETQLLEPLVGSGDIARGDAVEYFIDVMTATAIAQPDRGARP